jgi:endonuclease/exonuclease/phosphatase family metal-dependent hydrolase
LRVASFNIRNGRAWDGWNSWPFRKRSTLATIRQLDADVLGLQEVFPFQRQWLAHRLRKHDVLGEFRDGGRHGEGTPLFLRRGTVEHDEAWTRWFGGVKGARMPEASFPRIATSALVTERSTGTRVRVTNLHLDERSDRNRRVSVEELAGWLDEDGDIAHVVLGDFNATVENPLFEVLAARGLRQALPRGSVGTNHDFTGKTSGRRIDHIMVSASIEVRGATVVTSTGRRLPSDHWPVVADLVLPSDGT